MLERVLGNFDEKSLVKKAIGGIIGAVIVCLSLGISGNLEEPVLYFFFSFWLAVGIIYGVNVIRSIMSGCYMTERFYGKMAGIRSCINYRSYCRGNSFCN